MNHLPPRPLPLLGSVQRTTLCRFLDSLTVDPMQRATLLQKMRMDFPRAQPQGPICRRS
jgi:hypothetical protein